MKTEQLEIKLEDDKKKSINEMMASNFLIDFVVLIDRFAGKL